MKPVLSFKESSQKKYTQLLIILIVNFVLAPFLDGIIGKFFSSAILLYAIIIIVRTFSLHKKFFLLYLGIAVLAFALENTANFGWYSFNTTFFLLLIQGVYTLYLGIAAYLIVRDILLRSEVTKDTIYGGICVYLLIGFVWALFYGIVMSLEPQAFSRVNIEAEFYDKLIYFSFTTLTTLGYGDIIPVTHVAKMLTNMEAIIGQLYPSILIAILVSGYTSKKTK